MTWVSKEKRLEYEQKKGDYIYRLTITEKLGKISILDMTVYATDAGGDNVGDRVMVARYDLEDNSYFPQISVHVVPELPTADLMEMYELFLEPLNQAPEK